MKMENFVLTDGWAEFVAFYPVVPGDRLGFFHVGNIFFKLLVFGHDLREKFYLGAAASHPGESIWCNPNLMPRLIGSSFLGRLTTSALDRGKLYVPKSYTRFYLMGIVMEQRVRLVDEKERKWYVSLKPLKGGVDLWLYGQWKVIADAKELKKGDVICFK